LAVSRKLGKKSLLNTDLTHTQTHFFLLASEESAGEDSYQPGMR